MRSSGRVYMPALRLMSTIPRQADAGRRRFEDAHFSRQAYQSVSGSPAREANVC